MPAGSVVARRLARSGNLTRYGYSRSVVVEPRNDSMGPTDFILTLAAAADGMPQWGTAVRSRDQHLRAFWPTEPVLASALFSTCAKYAGFGWHVAGPARTVTIVHDILHHVEKGQGWLPFIVKVLVDLFSCVAAPTKVSLGGERRGQTKEIARMVADRDPGPVISRDAYGFLVERPVVGWHRNPLGGREWWWMSTRSASGHSKDRPGGLYLTEDHPMLLDRGWVETRDVKVGDRVATSDPEPSARQCELIVGGLLGDLAVSQTTKRSMLRLSHSPAQKEWLDLKMQAFSGFQWTGYQELPPRVNISKSRIISSSGSVVVNSRSSLGLERWRADWYPNGKKALCREDVEKFFGPLALATWYMDDGHLARNYNKKGGETRPGITLSVQDFSRLDAEWLAGFLTGKGYPAKVYFCSQHGGSGCTLHLGVDSAEKVFRDIAPYVPSCLRYKLPGWCEGFDPSAWEIEGAGAFFDEVVACEPRSYAPNGREAKTTYCLDIEETHNFVAAGLIAHNCDNGAHIEIIRTDDDPLAPVVSLKHLDSIQCRRTGRVEDPIEYTDADGRIHRLRWYQVISLSEFPMPLERAYGAQVCAVSRVLTAAQIMRDIHQYKSEKISGKNVRAIHLVGGVSARAVRQAMTQHISAATAEGFQRYFEPLVVASVDPNATVSKATLEMASLPDGFNEETAMRWYINNLALAFGGDYQDYAPLPGGNLGTAQQSEILHLKSRGKGPALFMRMLEHQFNVSGVMPRSVTFSFGEQDVAEDEQRQKLRNMRAQERAIRLKGGGPGLEEITPEIARQLANDSGDLPEQYLGIVGEENALETITLSSSVSG